MNYKPKKEPKKGSGYFFEKVECPLFLLMLFCSSALGVEEVRVHRAQYPVPISSFRGIGGFVGERIRANRENYVATFDIDHFVGMVEQKKHRDWWWIGEQPGKWLESAALNAAWSGDEELLRKAREVLDRIAAAQDDDGYVGITDPAVRTAEKPLRGMDPYELYFMMHGLLSAHEQWENDAALKTAQRLGDYFVATIGPDKAQFWPSDLRPPENKQKHVGGQSAIAGHGVHYCWEGTLLIDPMLRLYELTGQKKYLDWSRWVIENIDRWSGWDSFSKLDAVAEGRLGVHELQPYVHSHTFQMNFLGFLRMYQVTGEASYLKKVVGAWDDVAKRQMYITGGVSVGEHYERGHIKPLSGHVVETCATMSWMEVTQYLLELTGEPKYADALERLLINHVFAAQTIDGDCNRYHTPPNGTKHDYFHGPDCCTGSGHRIISLLPLFLYAKDDQGIIVNQYVPSQVRIDLKGKGPVELRQATAYPENERIVLHVDPAKPCEFTLRLRVPGWCEKPSVTLGGHPVENVRPGTYVELTRRWKSGDKVELRFPMRIRWVRRKHHMRDRIVRLEGGGGEQMREAELDPDPPWALMRGPVVYTFDTVWQDFAQNTSTPIAADDVAVDLKKAASPLIKSAPERALGPALETELLTVEGQPLKVRMLPFANVGRWYKDPNHRPDPHSRAFSYATWIPNAKGPNFQKQVEADRAVKARFAKAVDYVLIGNEESETTHGVQGGATGPFRGRTYRHAGHPDAFQYTLKVSPVAPCQLVCTYWGSDINRVFDVLINGRKVATQTLNNNRPDEFFQVAYEIPLELIRGKTDDFGQPVDTVEVKFVPHVGNTAGGLFGIVVMRAKDVDQSLLLRIPRYEVGPLIVTLHGQTQTVDSLTAKGSDVDFTPDMPELNHLGPGFHHLGDVTLRFRVADGPWQTVTSAARIHPVEELPADEQTGVLAAAELSRAMGDDLPVSIKRTWARQDGKLVMRFELVNRTDRPVEIGAFGAAMAFNNYFNEAIHGDHVLIHQRRFYAQPYIGGDGGYLQVTRVDGRGPVLLLLPEDDTPLEAYRHLKEHPFRRDCRFEGFYEWNVHTRAYAENEWKQARQWNPATSRTLKPGGIAKYGWQFVLSPSVREVEKTLIEHGRPVVVGVPGFVLPQGETARMFVKSAAPIEHVTVEPDGALSVTSDAHPTRNGWRGYTLRGNVEGRCRVTVTYRDHRRQYVHYNVIASQDEQVGRLAHFHQTKQWYDDPADKWGRTYAFMPWDREANRMVLDDFRVFICGLSDEPGAGANLLMASKNQYMPDPAQIAQLEQYVDETLWGKIQSKQDHSVRAGLYFRPGGCWDEARTKETWRAYNYPHHTATYWSLYRLARNHKGLVKRHPWQWYLRQAYRTAMAMEQFCGPGTGDGNVHQLDQWGLMVGSVFLDVLRDLKREGWTEEGEKLQAYMRRRAELWKERPYPFGSEMPWGPTSQEEIYAWCKHFGFREKADLTIDTIVAGAPAVPNWGYNGSMHFYFGANCYGKWTGLERELHWYLSSLCATATLHAFRENPDDFHLLRIGYGGSTGVLSNIDQQGHGSMSFHAVPALMDFDPYTADYGCHFYGYCHNAGSYVVKHDEFGWLGFGCDVEPTAGRVTIVPRDAFRQRVYLAPLGLWLTLDCGRFERLAMNLDSQTIDITLAAADPFTPTARLRIENPGGKVSYVPAGDYANVREAWEIKLSDRPVTIQLKPTGVSP